MESVWQKRAVERNLEILGEAARYVSPEFQGQHPEIDWRNTVGLRNLIIHRYRQVNHELLWNIVQDVLPELLLTLQVLLPEEPESG